MLINHLIGTFVENLARMLTKTVVLDGQNFSFYFWYSSPKDKKKKVRSHQNCTLANTDTSLHTLVAN